MFHRLIFLALSLGVSGVALAAGETALMPGEVIQGHAKLEENCKECHVRFDKAAQTGLCSDCHKEVKADIRKHEGLHGRIPEQECRECHTEHKGRGAKIVVFDTKGFDHAKTDFPLLGAHQKQEKVKCKDCHETNKKYREASTVCNDCHRKVDKHKGSLGTDCKSCHNERDWKETRFDHTLEKTHFALKGKHADVKCSKCHVTPDKFKGASHECAGCHLKVDKHKGQYGKKCETCHVERDWKKIVFNHDLETKFKLLGKHDSVKCVSCHKTPLFTGKEKTPTTCIGCHKKDDKHKGEFGIKCESCHKEKDWKAISFDHDRDTKYALKGKHEQVKCIACHTGKLYQQKLSMDCVSCHTKQDVHKGQLGKRCESCHNEKDWKDSRIDHGRTRFPLLGMHTKVECKKCHVTQLFRDAPSDCYSCHKKDDAHKLRLGKKCESCHNARSWKAWDFDHDRSTKFKLDGGHKKLDCYACHKKEMGDQVMVSRTCAGCHENDDVHQGEYGQQCERCHVTSKFRTLRIGSRMK